MSFVFKLDTILVKEILEPTPDTFQIDDAISNDTLATSQPKSPPVPPPPPPHEVARRPKTLKAPRHPTQAEIDEHLLTHLPFADWCECCVSGRRPNAPHKRHAGPPRTLPLITAD